MVSVAGIFALANIGLAATPITINITGTDDDTSTSGGNVEITAPSSINGSATQDGKYTVKAGDSADNQSTLNVTSTGGYRGILATEATGTYYNDSGSTTTFGKGAGASVGGKLQNDGTYTNGGTTTFATGSEYAGSGTFTNQFALAVDTGMANNSALTLLNALDQTGTGRTTITGSSAIFNSAAFNHANSVGAGRINTGFVLETTGDYTQNFNVNDAYLEIAGDVAGSPSAVKFSGTVTAGEILVLDRQVTFTNTVTTNATAAGTRDFVVQDAARVIFSGAGALNSGNVIIGGGATYGHMVFETGTSFNGTGATITVTGTGTIGQESTLTFANGSTYNNAALVNATNSILYYSTGTTNFSTLFNNTSLTASTLYITESNGSAVNLALAAGDINSKVIVRDGGSFKDINAQSAALVFASSAQTTNIAGNLAASSVDIQGTVNMESNYSMVTTAGGQVTVSSGGRLQVNQGSGTTLSINTNGGNFIANGGSVEVGAGKVLQISGNAEFAAGSSVYLAANSTSLSHIDVTGTIDVSGTTNVILTGSRTDIMASGNYLMQATGAGSITNVTNLQNTLYTFKVVNTGGNDQVVIDSYRSMLDVMADAFGEDHLSKNKINGGKYTDAILDTQWGGNNVSLNEYIQQAASSTLGANRSFIAFGQLYGEYGAYASSPLLANANSFVNAISQHMDQGMRSGADSHGHACVVDVCADPCGETEVLVVAGTSDIATGRSRIWAGGFGDWQNHDNKRYIHGYDYSSAGVVVGYDYDLDGFTMGVAGAYNYGTLKVNNLDTKYRSDMLSLGAYAGYTHESGVYARGTIAYNHGWNEYDVNMILGGMKKGDYKNHAFTGALEIGYQADLAGDFYMTPSVGVVYTHLRQDDWTEKLSVASAPLVANRFEFSRHNSVDIPVSLAIGRDFRGDGYVIRPEVRGSYIYQATGARNKIRTGYSGSGTTTTMYGVDAGAHRGVVGGALTANFAKGVGITAAYDYEFSGRYSNHNVTGAVTVAF